MLVLLVLLQLVMLAGIANIDCTTAGITGAVDVDGAPGLAFSQQTHFNLFESLRVMQSEHSHLSDC